MTTKLITNPVALSSAVSMASSFQSIALVMRGPRYASVSIACTTSNAIGTFTLQGNAGDSIWYDLGGIATMSVASANINFGIDVQKTGWYQLRISYIASSGTGTCTVTAFAGS